MSAPTPDELHEMILAAARRFVESHRAYKETFGEGDRDKWFDPTPHQQAVLDELGHAGDALTQAMIAASESYGDDGVNIQMSKVVDGFRAALTLAGIKGSW